MNSIFLVKAFLRRFIRKGMRRIYSLYAFLIFGKRVFAHGFFRVQMPENVLIGQGCSINSGVFIVGRFGVVIGDGVTLSARVMLIDTGLEINGVNGNHISRKINIQNHVWIGAGAIILPGVTIGQGSVVGAGSVVTKNIPAYCVAVGNPAKPIKMIAPTVGSPRFSTDYV